MSDKCDKKKVRITMQEVKHTPSQTLCLRHWCRFIIYLIVAIVRNYKKLQQGKKQSSGATGKV